MLTLKKAQSLKDFLREALICVKLKKPIKKTWAAPAKRKAKIKAISIGESFFSAIMEKYPILHMPYNDIKLQKDGRRTRDLKMVE